MKKLTIREYVENLPNDVIYRMVYDHKKYEIQGYIDECTLRNHAQTYIYNLGVVRENVLEYMDKLMFEVYRRLAMLHINSLISENT